MDIQVWCSYTRVKYHTIINNNNFKTTGLIMFNYKQCLDVHKVSIFCLENIRSSYDFDSFASSAEIYLAKSLYFDLYPEADMPTISEAVAAIFVAYLKNNCGVDIDFEYSTLSENFELEMIKQKAVSDEDILQHMRANKESTSIDEYIAMYLRVHKDNELIMAEEQRLLEGTESEILSRVILLAAEIVAAQEAGQDAASQYLKILDYCYISALKQFISKAVENIYLVSTSDNKVADLLNLEQEYRQKWLGLNPTSDEWLNNTQVTAFKALAMYCKMTATWVDTCSDHSTKMMMVLKNTAKLAKVAIIPEIDNLFRLTNFRSEAMQYVIDWLLIAPQQGFSTTDLKQQAKFISLWQQFFTKDELSHVLRSLSGWQINFTGVNLRIVLACKLKLEKQYVEQLSFAELKDYYDFIASETVERQSLHNNPLWFSGLEPYEKTCTQAETIRANTEYYNSLDIKLPVSKPDCELSKYADRIIALHFDISKLKTSQTKTCFEMASNFRNIVRRHDAELLEYIAKMIEQYDPSWYTKKYDATYDDNAFPVTSLLPKPVIRNISPPRESYCEDDDLLPPELQFDDNFDANEEPDFRQRCASPSPYSESPESVSTYGSGSGSANNGCEDDLISDEDLGIDCHNINLNEEEDRPTTRCSSPFPNY